jgi:hypothetical protein
VGCTPQPLSLPLGVGYPLLPLSCRCGSGCSGCLIVIMVVAMWCTPCRRCGVGAPPVVLIAVGASSSFSRPWVLPHSSLWPCGAPLLSLWPCGAPWSSSSLWLWMPPRCNCGCVVAVWWPPLVLVALGTSSLVPVVVWSCGASWSSMSPWVPLRLWVPPRCPCGYVVAPARPHGRVVPPCLSLWPCGGPPSFSRPWVLPCSSSWPCGASLVVVVAVGALDAVDAPPVVLVAVGTSLLVPVVVWCPLVAVIAVWCVPGGRRGCVRAWW